ncbi:hypothetical protein BKA80DRAFT_257041 [Phyllosticta citrichinensis]
MPSTKVYIVVSEEDSSVIDVCASKACADERAKSSEESARVNEYQIVGGTVTVSKPKAAARVKKSTKTKGTADGEDEDDAPTIPEATKNALKDEVIAFTGTLLLMTRKEAQDLAQAAGATTPSSINKDCTIVVIGSKPGQKKLDQIAKMDIDTVTEAEFLEMVQKGAAAGFKRASEDEEDDEEAPTKPVTKKLKA